ncbi:LamB/YcsF family protein [Providencia rustigianii]|uniref:5-oxoprolinase subunit A n=1 Tax=Providencia rustigianii TaxID=158850 RepID=A0A379G511_9GAMM|nr:5-oxoprolinase subunit PxpA [Providencia rustigianii]SUC35972.1 LamB/YcsF family protein [Providencia rustigianii]
MNKQIDLNSDLGESFGQWEMGYDEAMLSIVSSANIACGFHAGSPEGIMKTLASAKKNGVTVGAHVGYPDLVGFGRRNMDIASEELIADVIYQIGALQGLAKAVGAKVEYVKPHGALYNTIAHDQRQAMAVIDGILAIDGDLTLVALAGSPLVGWAKGRGLNVVAEAFADRAYNNDGTLVSRKLTGAVLHDPELVAERMLQLVNEGGVISIDGQFTPIDADSICVHGDSPGALEMAKKVREIFEQQGIKVCAFTGKRCGS